MFIPKKIKEGDISAFEQLFKSYYLSLCLYSTGITGRREVAEEIVQELFYTLWKDREHLNILCSMKAYLYGAVRNQSIQYYEQHLLHERHQQHIASSSAYQSASTPHEQMEYHELEEIIRRTLSQLPSRRRRIFIMHRFEGLKYKEMATQLSLSVKTIEAEMTKAYKQLRKEIEKYTY